MEKTVKWITWAGFGIVIGLVFLTAPAVAEDKCKTTGGNKMDACANKKTPQKIQRCINRAVNWGLNCYANVHRKYYPQLRDPD